jgi:chaperonin GroEL
MKNNLKLCTITPPNFGYKQHELMNDIALSVGATYFSQSTGDDLSIINFSDLGRAKKIIVGADKTIVMKDDTHVDDQMIDQRVTELWDAHKGATKKIDKEFIASRIASLTGGVGVIKVGGATDLEQKELMDRVDDAVCAVRSALSEGILPGGGLALWEAVEFAAKSKSIARAILEEALQAPLNQILTNAGLEWSPMLVDFGQGLNVKTGETGDMIKMGIIDPNKVTKTALQNAVSVAVTILSTNAIVTMARTYESK